MTGVGLAPPLLIADLHADGAMIEPRGLGGAAARVAPDATAYAHRDAEELVVAGAMLSPDADADADAYADAEAETEPGLPLVGHYVRLVADVWGPQITANPR